MIIRSNFIARVGKNEERRGVTKRFRPLGTSEAERDLIELCHEYGLTYMRNYVRCRRRLDAHGKREMIGARRVFSEIE